VKASVSEQPKRRRGAPRGPRQSDQNKKALIEAAEKLFIEKGYDAATMDEIASTANFAKGTLYHYFSNKEKLLTVMRKNFEKKVMERIRPAVEECAENDWIGRIKAWVYSAVDAYFDMSDLHDVVIYGKGMPFRNTMVDAEITRYLAKLIADGAKAGAWKIDDAHWTATIMFYSFRGSCDEAILGTQPAKDVPEKLNDVFMRILGI